MSRDRKAEALGAARAELLAVRDEIYAVVDGRSDADLLRRPADGGWCAAEVLDHIRTAESQLGKALGKMRRGEPVRIPRRAWWYRLPMSPVFWPIRIPVPKPVRPRRAADLVPAQVLDGLRESRRALLAFADELGPETFSRFLFPHFLLGRFDGLDWFRFIARHERKHLGQLRRTLGDVASAGR